MERQQTGGQERITRFILSSLDVGSVQVRNRSHHRANSENESNE
jgi:hypothetical protein